MTRGKKLVILIGEPRAIAMALGSKNNVMRSTLLPLNLNDQIKSYIEE